MKLKELKSDVDGLYGLRCGRVHESCMDVWARGDHARGVIVRKSGKCEPWHIDGPKVVKDAPFRLKESWGADRKARELRARI